MTSMPSTMHKTANIERKWKIQVARLSQSNCETEMKNKNEKIKRRSDTILGWTGHEKHVFTECLRLPFFRKHIFFTNCQIMRKLMARFLAISHWILFRSCDTSFWAKISTFMGQIFLRRAPKLGSHSKTEGGAWVRPYRETVLGAILHDFSHYLIHLFN